MRGTLMLKQLEVIMSIGLCLGLVLAFAPEAVAQQNPVTAIDIALEPDATMLKHAKDANARLLKEFPRFHAAREASPTHLSAAPVRSYGGPRKGICGGERWPKRSPRHGR